MLEMFNDSEDDFLLKHPQIHLFYLIQNIFASQRNLQFWYPRSDNTPSPSVPIQPFIQLATPTGSIKIQYQLLVFQNPKGRYDEVTQEKIGISTYKSLGIGTDLMLSLHYNRYTKNEALAEHSKYCTEKRQKMKAMSPRAFSHTFDPMISNLVYDAHGIPTAVLHVLDPIDNDFTTRSAVEILSIPGVQFNQVEQNTEHFALFHEYQLLQLLILQAANLKQEGVWN